MNLARSGLGVVLALVAGGCHSEPATVRVIDMSGDFAIGVSPVSATVAVGDSVKFSAYGTSPATQAGVVWSSSDTLVAVIRPTGVVVGKRAGVVSVVARARGDTTLAAAGVVTVR